MPYLVLDASTAASAPTVNVGAPATSGEFYTLKELYDELVLRLGSRTDVTLTRATKWINDSYRDIAASLDLPELKGGYSFSTVASQPLYLLPVNVKSINKVGISDSIVYANDGGTKLIALDESRYRTLADATGDPTYYYQVGRMLVLYPTPTSVKTIIIDAKFRPKPLLVANSTTERPILEPEWNEGLLRLATQYGFNALLQFDLAANAENQFISWTRRQKDNEADNQEDKIKHFGVARSWIDLRRSSLYDSLESSNDN